MVPAAIVLLSIWPLRLRLFGLYYHHSRLIVTYTILQLLQMVLSFAVTAAEYMRCGLALEYWLTPLLFVLPTILALSHGLCGLHAVLLHSQPRLRIHSTVEAPLAELDEQLHDVDALARVFHDQQSTGLPEEDLTDRETLNSNEDDARQLNRRPVMNLHAFDTVGRWLH